jgi:iron complex outermembrane receptor protein
MKFTISFFLSLLIAGSIYAQQNTPMKGRVVNDAGEGIQKASVVLLNTGLGAVTDGAGYFQVSYPGSGKYQLMVTAMGYASLLRETDSGKDTGLLMISMSPSYAHLDEVIVSAEKAEERLQSLPSTVSSIGSRQVTELRLWNISSITAVVPNLYSANSGDNRNVTSIRGIGTTSYEQAVATYVDGVNQFSLDTYIPNLFDIERIEVLRGPQGTLYGRNAMGGVINIITKKPSNRTQTYAEANVGNFGLLRLSMAVKTPLIKDKLFLGVAALYEQRKGYYTNEFNGKDFDRQKNINGNYYLKYIPIQKLDITLNVKHLNNRNNGPFPLATDRTTAFEKPYTVNQDAVTTMNDDNLNASLSLQLRAAAFRFSSLTAFQSNYRVYENPIDGDFSPLDAISIVNNYGKDFNKVKVWTQEFRFSSPDYAPGKWKWTAGTFFFTQDNPVKQGVAFGKDAMLLGIPDSNFTTINTNLAKNKGLAVFGQFSYKITEKLSVVAGLRYDLENRKLAISGEYYKAPGPAFPVMADTSASDNFDALSPKAGLQYQISADQSLYLNYSRGYRSGGFTSLTSDPSQPPLYAYEPESSNNIELGWKNYFWDKRLTLNAALFYSFVDNVQVPTLVLPDAITVISNSGKLNTKGAEIEVSARAFKGLEIFYSAGITDAVYGTLNLPVNGNVEKLDGNHQIFTPAYTSFLTGQYSYVPGKNASFRFTGRVEWMVLGKQYYDLSNTISQEAYGLVNARLGIEMKHVGIFVWSRNLGDKKYISYAYDFGGIHLGDPRTYGVTLSVVY